MHDARVKRVSTPLGELEFTPVETGRGGGAGSEQGRAGAGAGRDGIAASANGTPFGSRARAGSEAGEDRGPRAWTANGRPRASRASQFMPFAALTGYYELVREQERVVEPRHEPTEEEALALSRTMAQLRRGDLVRATYYDGDGYRDRVGIVSGLDMAMRRLQLGSLTIAFDDIRDLERRGVGHG